MGKREDPLRSIAIVTAGRGEWCGEAEQAWVGLRHILEVDLDKTWLWIQCGRREKEEIFKSD